MDPNETLRNLLDAETADVAEHAKALGDWIAKGGFMPEIDRTAFFLLMRGIESLAQQATCNQKGETP